VKLRSWLVLGALSGICWTGLAAASGLEKLASGEELPCESRDGKTGQQWPCVIRITSRDGSTGAIAGEVKWTTLGAVHRIEGRLSGNGLTFRETEAIQAGSAHLNVAYSMTISGNVVTGTYVDHTDGGKGTATITLPEGEPTGDLELAARASGAALLVSGKSFPCESRDPKSKRKWPCRIKITSHKEPTGALVGELTWTESTAVHRIEGKLLGDRLTFTETKAIRKGPVTLKSTYTMKVLADRASGSFTDPVNKASGTMTITLK
jgi:hypothetical protein